MGVDLIVLGFSSMDSLHIEGMAKNEGDPFFLAQIGQPVPGEDAFHSNHDIFPEGSDDAKKGLRRCFDVLVNTDVAPGIQDTDVHFSCM
jgi:hypothetical protein